MDDMVSLFLTGQREFSDRVAEVGNRWSLPTPDDEWDVGALVDHLIDEARWVAPLVSGSSLAEADEIVKAMPLAADDRVAAWEQAAFAASEAFSSPGALDRTVDLSRGATPVREYLGEMIFDLCVHSWDLGKAIGSSRELPDELVEPVYELVLPYGDLSAFPGAMFKPAREAAEDAPTIEKLLAFTGRDPSWSAG